MAPAVLKRLREDHVRLARVMGVLEREVDYLDVDDLPEYPLLAAIVEYVRTYADAVHHPTEDQVFDQLLHKGLTPAERHVVYLNLGKHQEINETSRKLQDKIDSILRGDVLPVENLKDRPFGGQRNPVNNWLVEDSQSVHNSRRSSVLPLLNLIFHRFAAGSELASNETGRPQMLRTTTPRKRSPPFGTARVG